MKLDVVVLVTWFALYDLWYWGFKLDFSDSELDYRFNPSPLLCSWSALSPFPPPHSEMTIGGNNSFDSKSRLPRSYLSTYLLNLHLTFHRNSMLLQMTISSNIFLQQHPCGLAWQGGYPICKCHPIFIVSSHCCHWAFCHVPLQHLGIGWSASSYQPSIVRITTAVKPVWFD